jgi:hypothetical protein
MVSSFMLATTFKNYDDQNLTASPACLPASRMPTRSYNTSYDDNIDQAEQRQLLLQHAFRQRSIRILIVHKEPVAVQKVTKVR